MADIMSSKLQHIPLLLDKKKPEVEIEQISAGSTISAAVLSNGGGLYFWGTSGTTNYRSPLPMKVRITSNYVIINISRSQVYVIYVYMYVCACRLIHVVS
jgi:hypothetical protein